ncbi:unnamed protein product [Mytilus edulis]|uniref:Uncharacterized protein n=1 Tax=Mytilus edulis TaxID=6550 RepID=A0A8S3SET3_MYTED|nr:unnamed protein product [Mytilus edulis]
MSIIDAIAEEKSKTIPFDNVKNVQMNCHLESKTVNVRCHSHDRNSSISSFIEKDKHNVIDCLDTWHAGKEVRKAITKVAKGAKKNHGVLWHRELADKVAGVKTHTYWAMKNCEGSTQRFIASLDNIVNHYQNNHQWYHPTSRCKTEPYYTLSRTMIRDDIAAGLLKKAIKSLCMYKKPEKYIHCLNTHYIESFRNTLLLYVDKRVHYGEKTYEIRTGLGVLDWNEHVDRPVSSEKVFRRAAQTRNRAPERVLKPKTYSFVRNLWDIYCNFLTGDIQPFNICDNIQENNVEDDSILQESEDSENEESDDDI